MGALAADTAVDGGAGHYRVKLSQDWEIWGPNGGYVAAVALRAAACEVQLDDARPVSLSCQFLRSARFGLVEIEVVPLRRTRRAQALRVEMTQDNERVLEAQLWAVGAVEGLEHDHAPIPRVEPPEATPTLEARYGSLPRDDPRPRPAPHFWRNIDFRPLDWIDEWPNRAPRDPVSIGWFRFRPEATSSDVWVDAARSVIVVDTLTWPSATRAHAGPTRWVAPNLDLAVHFHHAAPDQPWLLGRGHAPVAQRGTLGCTVRVWAGDGRLVASGGASLLCTSAPTPD